MPFKKILVPLDGSTNSELVLGWVNGLAKALQAELVLLAVVNPADLSFSDGDAVSAGGGKSGKTALDREIETAREYLESEAAKYQTKTLKASQRVATGNPKEVIIDEVKKSGADMIAMATHRGGIVERGILGSVTDTVLRTSPVPVLAVRPEGRGSFSGNSGAPSAVIVPLDGSELAAESVPVAMEIAKACSAEMVFVRAVHLPNYAVAGPGVEYYDVSYGVSGERRTALDYLAPFVQQAQKKGLQARAHAALGNAASRILEEISNVQGGMVVIASHGRGGVKRMLLGSVADKIVRASHHPVLVITHHEK